ncbi:diaminopimelate epimerase [Sandaracinus amylolyticus]|uniref:Diaminopimelate epimerase n=1 Tax=Sandaracinus amylolyticus TaxID=927083 RepID=A0A0F6YN36_9BACT|nr:diaminopimelate epimerase [Sandaracinus amylolyticus]AKF09957.1 Diaminopimelate epimerase [Sandaracinus amylolyticus]
MRPLLFEKYEGLGNDFVVVEGTSSMLSTDDVMRICDRHRGIGADGVLFTGVSAGRPFMSVINADGSTAEMCGNGLRCVALHLVRRGLVDGRTFDVDTDAGPHAVRVLEVAAPGRVEVSMRAPSLAPRDVPARFDAPLIDGELRADGVVLHGTAVSMGNPHLVTFDAPDAARLRLGPMLQDDRRFPEKVNVGFATMKGRGAMQLHVYERGSGWTQACGTGACAAAVAAVETGRASRGAPIEVVLPGGPLEIVVGEAGERVRMTGPARHVFSGRLTLPL